MLRQLDFLKVCSGGLSRFFEMHMTARDQITRYRSGTTRSRQRRTLGLVERVGGLGGECSGRCRNTVGRMATRLRGRGVYLIGRMRLSRRRRLFISSFCRRQLGKFVDPI